MNVHASQYGNIENISTHKSWCYFIIRISALISPIKSDKMICATNVKMVEMFIVI